MLRIRDFIVWQSFQTLYLIGFFSKKYFCEKYFASKFPITKLLLQTLKMLGIKLDDAKILF